MRNTTIEFSNYSQFVADFETTVYTGQTETEVWSAAITFVGADNEDDVVVLHSIDEFMTSFHKLGMLKKRHIKIYFHNLKFDGCFILNWLLRHKQPAVTRTDADQYFTSDNHMFSGDFKYMISSKGQFYSIKYKIGHTMIEFLDSVKMIPISLKEVGIAFDTLHKKLEMEYTGLRYAGCTIKENEMHYIKNDVLVPAEALDIYINEENHKKSTIGSNCIDEFKNIISDDMFHIYFPCLADSCLPTGEVEDDYIRPSYKGGYCICWRQGQATNGVTLDVNSEYPFVMSEFKIPYGRGKYHSNGEPQVKKDKYFFVRIKTNFKLKENHLPTIQIKNNALYKGNEWLKTSYIYLNGEFVNHYTLDGKEYDTRQEITLCETDYLLLKDHYYLEDFEIIDYVEYDAKVGLFDEYIDKYYSIKQASKGGKRFIAKLFLNNLYGKLGTSPDSSFKIAKLVDGVLKWELVEERKKQVFHVASASAITGWARWWTITHAQANYDHFCYADTDSLHLDCTLDQVKDIEVDKNKLGAWDCEKEWTRAIFLRQKTYIEINDETKEVSVVACGMGKRAQKNIKYALGDNGLENESEIEKSHLDMCFIKKGMKLEDFKPGLIVNGNLKMRQIKGGPLLFEDTFELN